MHFGSMNLINCTSNSNDSFNSVLIPDTALSHMNYLTEFLSHPMK